jgi:hypothetical protein
VQLISYIAPGAPATRRPFSGELPFLRPEIGFTPKWFRNALGIDFGERWHKDPDFRRQTRIEMYDLLNRRFPGAGIGQTGDKAVDILTGTYGTLAIASIYGIPARFENDQWPASEHKYLSDDEIVKLALPDLDRNPFFCTLMEQVDHIGELEGKIIGYMNWQGVLNNAQRLTGQNILVDMYTAPEKIKHLLECVSTTMIDAAFRLQKKQNSYKDTFQFFTVSNCLVNMIEPALYEEFILPFDKKIADAFGTIGIHNCAWSATPYLGSYSRVRNVAYIDMGMDSDMEKARRLFPDARRAIMYRPVDVANKSINEIKADIMKIAKHYGPCDLVAADIEDGTPDRKILDIIRLCKEISDQYQSLS